MKQILLNDAHFASLHCIDCVGECIKAKGTHKNLKRSFVFV